MMGKTNKENINNSRIIDNIGNNNGIKLEKSEIKSISDNINPYLKTIIEKHKDKPNFIEFITNVFKSIDNKKQELKEFPEFSKTIETVFSEFIMEQINGLEKNPEQYKLYIQKLFVIKNLDVLFVQLLFFDDECTRPTVLDKNKIKKILKDKIDNLAYHSNILNKIYEEFK